jgi:hypothetical protein
LTNYSADEDTRSINSNFEDFKINDAYDTQNDSDRASTSTLGEDDENHHNLRSERLPDVPIYNPGLQSALTNPQYQLQCLSSKVSRCALASKPNTSLHTLSEQLKTLAAFEYKNTRTVGFVGDSGAGTCNED